MRSFDIMLQLHPQHLTTTTGLTVKAFLVDRAFQKGRKVSKIATPNIVLTDTCDLSVSTYELYRFESTADSLISQAKPLRYLRT